jgi:hypothetical protein
MSALEKVALGIATGAVKKSQYEIDKQALNDEINLKAYITDLTDQKILDKIKNVDGFQSGLDADLVRGIVPSNLALTVIESETAQGIRTAIGLGTASVTNLSTLVVKTDIGQTVTPLVNGKVPTENLPEYSQSTATLVQFFPTEHISSTNVQNALVELEEEKISKVDIGNTVVPLVLGKIPPVYLPGGSTTSISASATSFIPSGNLEATNVQEALVELDTEKLNTVSVGTTVAPLTSGKVPDSYLPDEIATITDKIPKADIGTTVAPVVSGKIPTSYLPSTGASTFYGFKLEGAKLILHTGDGSFNIKDYKESTFAPDGLVFSINTQGHIVITA